MSAFFDTFSALCREHGETPNSIGKALKIPSGSITAWKNGAIPRAQTLSKIADHFSVTTDYLLTGEQKEKSPSESGEGRAIDVVDDELREYLDELRSRPEKKLLFSVTKNATKEQIEAIVKMVEAMQGREKSE